MTAQSDRAGTYRRQVRRIYVGLAVAFVVLDVFVPVVAMWSR
jgi:hypothetical protein